LSDEATGKRSDEALRQIAQDVSDDGTWITTTLFLMRSITEQAADLEGTLAAMPEIKYVHPVIFEAMRWGPGENYYIDVGSRPTFPNYVAAQEQLLFLLNEFGGLLMAGTDANIPVMVPGFSLHDELETMADVGLSNYDVLRTSTYNPALYLGKLDEFGTIEEGKRADLVLLDSNPLEDIANTRKISGVMVRGVWFDRTDLDAILNAVAEDYESVMTTNSILKIGFPIVAILLLVVLAWMIVRKVRGDNSVNKSN